MCRREKTGFQYAAISLFMFFTDLKFFRVVLLVHEVSGSRFPFWRFRWVYWSLNFLYKLKLWLQNIPIDRRKRITFAFFFFTCVVSKFWDFSSVISSGVYNGRSFCHGSWLSLYTSQQSSPSTFQFGTIIGYWFWWQEPRKPKWT